MRRPPCKTGTARYNKGDGPASAPRRKKKIQFTQSRELRVRLWEKGGGLCAPRRPQPQCLTNGELWQDEVAGRPAVPFPHPTAA